MPQSQAEAKNMGWERSGITQARESSGTQLMDTEAPVISVASSSGKHDPKVEVLNTSTFGPSTLASRLSFAALVPLVPVDEREAL
jgi:hypothetical protein